MIVYITEKPSQGRALADALHVPGQPDWLPGTPFRGDDERVICWSVGHCLELLPPGGYEPDWERWALETLPIIPPEFRFRPIPDRADIVHSLDTLSAALRDANGPHVLDEVVIATDAGREGEHIGRLVLWRCGWDPGRMPQLRRTRLWTSALTPAELRAANTRRRPLGQYDGLANAGFAREAGDWLTGINMTRLWSKAAEAQGNRRSRPITIGRVQTATLTEVVKRRETIDSFVPQMYYELDMTVATDDGAHQLTLHGAPSARATAPEELTDWVTAARGWKGPLRVETERRQKRAPLPYDLTALQAAANRTLGWTAAQTLQVAQRLYEGGRISYPRTDCRHYHPGEAADCRAVAQASAEAETHAHRDGGAWDREKAEASDHTAIRPLPEHRQLPPLTDPDEGALMELIMANFMGQYAGDWEYEVQRVTATVTNARGDAMECTQVGRRTLHEGWRSIRAESADTPGTAVDPDSAAARGKAADDPDASAEEAPPVPDGTRAHATDALTSTHRTRPPPELTEGRLLELMQQLGLGTQATRAAHIEKLRHSGYAATKGKRFAPTELGTAVVAALRTHLPDYTDAGQTARWERELEEVRTGARDGASFVRDTAAALRADVERLKQEQLPTLPEHPGAKARARPRRARAQKSR